MNAFAIAQTVGQTVEFVLTEMSTAEFLGWIAYLREKD